MTDDSMLVLKNNLKEVRSQMKLSQSQLAEMVGARSGDFARRSRRSA